MPYVNRGFVDDGSSSLSVTGGVTATTYVTTAQTLAGSGTVTIPGPGFYYVPVSGASGMGYFTGSMPAPGTFPGAVIAITDDTTGGAFNWLLSGSTASPRAGRAFFSKMSGSMPGALPTAYGGGTVAMASSGSIIMMSDGFHWCIIGGSGSMTLAGSNA